MDIEQKKRIILVIKGVVKEKKEVLQSKNLREVWIWNLNIKILTMFSRMRRRSKNLLKKCKERKDCLNTMRAILSISLWDRDCRN